MVGAGVAAGIKAVGLGLVSAVRVVGPDVGESVRTNVDAALGAGVTAAAATTSAQQRVMYKSVDAAHVVSVEVALEPYVTSYPPSQVVPDHTKLLSPWHPVPRDSSAASSLKVQRRAPISSQKLRAEAQSKGPLHPLPLSLDEQMAVSPNLAAFVHSRVSQDDTEVVPAIGRAPALLGADVGLGVASEAVGVGVIVSTALVVGADVVARFDAVGLGVVSTVVVVGEGVVTGVDAVGLGVISTVVVVGAGVVTGVDAVGLGVISTVVVEGAGVVAGFNAVGL